MKSNSLYKYINLLFRITIGVLALWFIYYKIENNFLSNFKQIVIKEINFPLIIAASLLIILNWGIEAVKWKFAIKKTQEITIYKALKLTITGVTLGLVTPNRIGEIPSRAALLNRRLFKELTLKTVVASFSQGLITLIMGAIGLVFTSYKFNFGINPTFIIIGVILLLSLSFLVYFKVNKLEGILNKIKYFREKEIFKALSEFSLVELAIILFMSLLRYVVFSIQFYLILIAFGVSLNSFQDIFLIPVCFMIASFIPTIFISEIGVRGTVAVFVFSSASNLEFQIIMSSILLWLINVAIPALVGLINIKRISILKTS